MDEESKQERNAERKDHPRELIELNEREVQSLAEVKSDSPYSANPRLNAKVELLRGDISALQVDAIVNAANETLLGGGGVDQAIHARAGPELVAECSRLPANRFGERCAVGEALRTEGHGLPAKFVIHTVAPLLDDDGQPQGHLLAQCYESCLRHVDGQHVRSLAFCCLGTGFYGFPMVPAAKIALGTVRRWLEAPDVLDRVDRVVFCTFTDLEMTAYTALWPHFFP